MEFKFEGLENPVVLPDKYLTVAQVEAAFRSLIKNGKEEFDPQDMTSLRILAQAVAGASCPDLGELRWSVQNQTALTEMYAQLSKLLSDSMGTGDEVTSAVETKKDEAGNPKRGRPRSQNK